MDVNRKELIEAMSKIKPGIANKEFLEQSTHFILNENEIISYNDEISIVYPIDLGVQCTVDASLFYKLASKLDGENLFLGLDGTTLRVESEGVKAKLPTAVSSEMFEYIGKLTKEQDELEWKKLPSDFISGISMCIFSASLDKTQGTLTCVWIEEGDIITFDKYRASWYQMESKVQDKFYIEADYLSALLDFEDPSEYCLSEGWAHFAMDNGVVFSARRTMPDKMLPVRTKFKVDSDVPIVSVPYSLVSAIETVSLTVEQEEKMNQFVTIDFGEDFIHCKGESERGSIEKEIRLDEPLQIEPFTFSAPPFSLIQVLTHATQIQVLDGRALFSSSGNKTYRHLLGLKAE